MKKITGAQGAFIVRILIEAYQAKGRRLLEAGYTGQKKDKLGHTRYYQDGRQVKNPNAKEKADIHAAAGTPLPAGQAPSHADAATRVNALHKDTPPEHVAALANDLMNMSVADLTKLSKGPAITKVSIRDGSGNLVQKFKVKNPNAQGDSLHRLFNSQEEAEKWVKNPKGDKQVDAWTPPPKPPEAPPKEKFDHDSFTETLPPKDRERAKKALEKEVRSGGAFITRKDLVKDKIKNGYKVTVSQKGERRLQNKQGQFMDEAAIGVTAMDYAEHLLKADKPPATKSPAQDHNAILEKHKADYKAALDAQEDADTAEGKIAAGKEVENIVRGIADDMGVDFFDAYDMLEKENDEAGLTPGYAPPTDDLKKKDNVTPASTTDKAPTAVPPPEEEPKQKRANKGGEIGPNGEHYKGGAFIATTDMPKKLKDKFKRAAGNGKEKVMDIKTGRWEFETPPNPGLMSIYKAINVGVYTDGQGNLFEPGLNYPAVVSAEKRKQIAELAEKYKAGEKWAPINDYPEIATPEHIYRLAGAGLPIAGALLDDLKTKAEAGQFNAVAIFNLLKDDANVQKYYQQKATKKDEPAAPAATDKPGFTGTDSQGRQWQDGELVAAKDKPTGTAAAAAGMNTDALALDALRLKSNKKPHNAAHITPDALASLKQQGFIDAANKLTNDGRAHLYLQKGKAVRKATGPAKPQAAAAPAPAAPATNLGADADALEALRLKSNKKQHNVGHITPDAVASLKRQGFIDEGNKLTPEGRLHLAAQKFSNAPKPTGTAAGAPGAPKPKWKRAARNKDSLISIVKRKGGINSDSVKAGYDYQADIIEGGLLHAIRKQGMGLDEMAQTLQVEGHIIVPEGVDPGEHLLSEMKARHHSALRNTDKEIESEEAAYYKAKQAALEGGHDERSIEGSGRSGAQTGESEGQKEGATKLDEWDNSGAGAQGSGEENAAVTGDGYDSADNDDYDRNATGQVDTSFNFGANVDEPKADEPKADEKEQPEKIGKGSTGDVTKQGDQVFKGATENEANAYNKLAGVEGVAPGKLEGDKIVLPFYKNVISVDTIPYDQRHTVAPILRRNLERMVNAVTALSDEGLSYNDPLQFGFDKDKKSNLLDFSMAGKDNNATRENLSALSNYLKQFGLEKHGDAISQVNFVMDYVTPGSRWLDDDSADSIDGAKIEAALDGKPAKYAYYSFNARTIPGVAQTGHRDAANVIFSSTPLSKEFMQTWEIHPAIHRTDTKTDEPAAPPAAAAAAAAPDDAVARHMQRQAFTGTDAQGREWRNGELVAAKDEPTKAPAGNTDLFGNPTKPAPKGPETMPGLFGEQVPIAPDAPAAAAGEPLPGSDNPLDRAGAGRGKQDATQDMFGLFGPGTKAKVDAINNGPDADPVTEPTTPAAAAAQPQPNDTPRTQAARVSAAMAGDFENARASAVPNMGKDLKGSARHKAMAWKGLQDAEANGTAEALVKRDELLKHDPSNLSSILDADNFLEVLTGHLAMQAFPKEVHNYAQYVSNTNEHKSTPAQLREQYYEAFTEIKKIVEEGPTVEVDHKEITKNINKKLKELISKFRKEGQGEPSPRLGKNYDGDRYNPVANSLINMQQRILNDGPASVLGKVNDFGRRLQKTTKDGRPSAETLQLAIKATGDILEGKSFNQAFDTVEKKAAGFDYSLAYGTKITRTGGKKIDMSEQSTSSPGAKVFMDDMKVRGVQFGNSLPDQERVYHAEKSAEALSDLTSILGLPDDAAGLGGKLGLAIGARGKAGAAAHFEPWQADNDASGTAGGPVINLTRANGAGSLAHEWGHGLDHFAANNGPGGKKFVSKGNGSNLSPLTSKAMKKVQEAMDASGFSSRLEEEIKLIPAEKQRHNLNTKTERDYWRSPEEKFARTFERHVQNKLHEAGRENTYLTGLHKVGHPLWPTNEEMAHIAPHMDALIAAIASEKFPNHKMPAPAPATPKAAAPAPATPKAPEAPAEEKPATATAAWKQRGSNEKESPYQSFQAIHGRPPTFDELHGDKFEKIKGKYVLKPNYEEVNGKYVLKPNQGSTITDVTPAGYGPSAKSNEFDGEWTFNQATKSWKREATMPTNEKAQKIKLVQAIIARRGIKPPQPKAQAKKTPEASGNADPRVKRIRELMDAYC